MITRGVRVALTNGRIFRRARDGLAEPQGWIPGVHLRRWRSLELETEPKPKRMIGQAQFNRLFNHMKSLRKISRSKQYMLKAPLERRTSNPSSTGNQSITLTICRHYEVDNILKRQYALVKWEQDVEFGGKTLSTREYVPKCWL